MTKIDGATLIARSLKSQGVDLMFGVVGFPVVPIAVAAQKEGIRYFGFRNEQAASYAAGVAGYLTGRPAACLTVSGPGMIHAIAGLSNAWSNCWPMILLGGANDSYQNGQGAFQEAPQIEAARPFVKYAARPDSLARTPDYIEQAVRTSIYGRPGATYLDLPNDIITDKIEEEDVSLPPYCPAPPAALADPREVKKAIEVLRSAKHPLVIVGKGAAYAQAEDQVRKFINTTQLPFLPTPMGKGVIPDSHNLSVASARSDALGGADVVFLIGARLNWILHFGLPPRFKEDVKFIQLDIAADEIGTNVPCEVPLVGDANSVMDQLNKALKEDPFTFDKDSEWLATLSEKARDNEKAVEAMCDDEQVPMGYYRVLREIRDQMPPDHLLVSEGANTMDISRSVLMHDEPRQRIDAGSFGTMGVGTGFAIAAAAVSPEKKVVCVQGDSAFGFSGMEIEVACRYQLPITFVIVNNNGIGGGFDSLDRKQPNPAQYTIAARYERMIEAFGGKGYFATTPEEMTTALKEAIRDPNPNIVNIMIDPKAQRKPQKFEWLTR